MIWTPRRLDAGRQTDALEARDHAPITEDEASREFTLGNLSVMKFTNVQVFLLFDFTGTNVGVSLTESGPFVEKSVFLNNPLTLTIQELGPGQRESFHVFMKSNLGGRPAERGNFQIGLAGHFNAETVLTPPDANPPGITGGLIPFSVVQD